MTQTSKKYDDMIFVVNVGTQEFNSLGHLHNFIKYLFSCSDNHTETLETKKNFYIQQDIETQKLKTYAFVSDSREKYNKFTHKFIDDLTDEDALENDIYHVGFIITIGKRTICNIYRPNPLNENEFITDIPEDTVDWIIEDYFDGDTAEYYEAVEDALDERHETSEYVCFKDASEKERLIIELKVHQAIMKKTPNFNVMVAVSHHDQDSAYHIHRVIKK